MKKLPYATPYTIPECFNLILLLPLMDLFTSINRVAHILRLLTLSLILTCTYPIPCWSEWRMRKLLDVIIICITNTKPELKEN